MSERHGVTDDIHDGIFSRFLNSKDKSSAYAKIVEIIREGQENEYNEMIASLGQWGYSGEFHKMEKISKGSSKIFEDRRGLRNICRIRRESDENRDGISGRKTEGFETVEHGLVMVTL